MAIKLAPPLFTAPVTYAVPGDGQPFEIKFSAQFARLARAERELLGKRLTAAGLQARLATAATPEVREGLQAALAELGEGITPMTDDALCRLVLRGWSLQDMDGVAIAFDAPTLDAVLEQWPGIETAIGMAYFAALSPQEAEKNSATPPATT